MERASRIIRKLALPAETFGAEQLVCAAWPSAVGKKIAAHTRALKLVRDRLVVIVEDEVWRKQLFCLSQLIVRNLDRAVGPGIVRDLEFRVVPNRREMQRETTSVPSVPTDEADAIADPVLRHNYIASREKLRQA